MKAQHSLERTAVRGDVRSRRENGKHGCGHPGDRIQQRGGFRTGRASLFYAVAIRVEEERLPMLRLHDPRLLLGHAFEARYGSRRGEDLLELETDVLPT